jgi:hypothetical protein
MMRTVRAAAAALLPLLLASCVRERPTVPQFMEVSREVLAFAAGDARESQPGRANDGPLYVNIRSFQAAAERATGESVSYDSMEAVLGEEPIQAELDQILLCDTTGTLAGCWVRQYGIFVNLNMVQLAGSEMSLYVRTSSTDRRRHPTDFCHRVWRLDYRKEGEAWRLAERSLLRSCIPEA